MPARNSRHDRWYLTEKGARVLARHAGIDEDQAVAAFNAQRRGLSAPVQPTSLRVLSGETMLTPDDADAIIYTTNAPADEQVA
jgi:hypothetical protein